MADHYITCTLKSPPFGPYQVITHVEVDGRLMTVDEIASQMTSQYAQNPFLRDRYWVQTGSGRVEVVAVTAGGRTHLQTLPDNTPLDNLVNLPLCARAAPPVR